jgi:hypothetical protein
MWVSVQKLKTSPDKFQTVDKYDTKISTQFGRC